MSPVARRHLVAGLWLAGLAAALYWAMFHTALRNDMTSFMPRAATPIQRLLMNELREGPVARLTIVTLEGAPADTLASLSRELAAALRESGHFVRIDNGEALLGAAERDRLFAYRYLLSPAVGPGRFDEAGLRAAVRQRLRELASPVPRFDRRWIREDLTGELGAMLAAFEGVARPRSHGGVWFDAEGERALLLAQTTAPGFDLDAQEAAQVHVRAVAAERGGEGIAVGLSGPGVFAVASRAAVREDTRRLGIMAAIVVVVILLAAYRDLRLLVIGGLPLLSAVAAGVVAVSVVYGAMHGIVLAFGITVIGVAIDYPIHLFSHLNDGETVGETLADVWPTIRLGAVTTAVGYLAMSGTGFPGLTQFATFAIAGLLAAAACTRWCLPGLLPAHYLPRPRSGFGARLGSFRRPSWPWIGLALTAGAAALAFLALGDSAPWEDDIAALSPIPESVMARDRHLHARLGVPDTNHVLAISAEDAESALVASETLGALLSDLARDGIITRFDLPSRYLPSVETQTARRAIIPEPERLARDLDRALEGTPFAPDAFAPFLEAAARARDLPPLTPEDLEGTALGLRLRSSLLPVEEGRVALVTLSGVNDRAALQDALDAAGVPGLDYLDLKRDTRSLMADFRRQASTRVLWGLVAIAAILVIGLRSPGRALRVLVPGLIGVLVAVALLRMAGEALSLFHLVSLLLVVGIGIDYGLFFSRDDRDPSTRGRTFHGLAVCALSTVAVFGILATSRLPVLHAIGTTVALGVALSFLTALVLSPRLPAADRAGAP